MDSLIIIIAMVTLTLHPHPSRLIWSAVFTLPATVGSFPGYREGVALLFVLQVLHVYWFWLVAGMAVKLARGEELQKDVRSDSELSSCS